MALKTTVNQGADPSHRVQRLVIAAAVVLAGGMVLVATRFFATRPAAPPSREHVVEAPAQVVPAELFFASADSAAVFSEVRSLALPENTAERLRMLVRELTSGPGSGGLRALPLGTSLRGAYATDGGETLILDFTRDFRNGLHWGSTWERLALGSLARTLGANMPGARRVQILVEGQVVESLGGHYDISVPLDLDEWKNAP